MRTARSTLLCLLALLPVEVFQACDLSPLQSSFGTSDDLGVGLLSGMIAGHIVYGALNGWLIANWNGHRTAVA